MRELTYFCLLCHNLDDVVMIKVFFRRNLKNICSFGDIVMIKVSEVDLELEGLRKTLGKRLCHLVRVGLQRQLFFSSLGTQPTRIFKYFVNFKYNFKVMETKAT